MNHINLGDDYRNLLLEKANWNKIGMSMSDESGATALEEEASAEVAETEEETEEEVVEENVETSHSCPVCSSEISEAVEPGLFLEHLEKVAELAEAIEYLNENFDDASEDEVLLGALSHVFPKEFEGVELAEAEEE